MVSRLPCASLFVIVLLTACRDDLKTKERVQEAIVNRLQSHSGLDLNSLTVNTTAVSFEKDKAYATVAFHAKNDPAVNDGMTMKYTLEERAGKWVVTGVADSQGHGLGSPATGAGQLPAGHPPLGPADSSSVPAETR